MSFERKTRQIFFNADVNKINNDLFHFFKTSNYLSLDPSPQDGYTIYPPLSYLGQDGNQYIFRFETHPHLSFKFREGELIILSTKSHGKEKYSSPIIKFIFDTKEQSERAYKELVDAYIKLSTRNRISTTKDTKKSEFTNDKSKSIREIIFLQGKGDILSNGYVIIFGLGNDIDIDTQ